MDRDGRNKVDLTELWESSDARIDAAAEGFDAIFRTSAKTGANVEDALTRLADVIIDRAIEEAS